MELITNFFVINDSPVFYPDICKTFKLPSKSFMKIIKPFQSSKSILTQVFASILALMCALNHYKEYSIDFYVLILLH